MGEDSEGNCQARDRCLDPMASHTLITETQVVPAKVYTTIFYTIWIRTSKTVKKMKAN